MTKKSQKFEYAHKEKSFLGEMKGIFHHFIELVKLAPR